MEDGMHDHEIDLHALLTLSPEAIRAAYADLHAQDFADLIERTDLVEAQRLLLALDADDAADVLEYIDSERQIELVERLGAKRAARIVVMHAGHVIESALIAHWQPCGGNRGIEIIDSRGAGMR